MTISPEGVDFQEIFDIIGAEESLECGEIADAVGISGFALSVDVCG